jgi:hypothetical protein
VIRVVCESGYVAQVIAAELVGLVEIRYSLATRILFRIDKFCIRVISVAKFLAHLKNLLKHWWICRQSRPKGCSFVTGDVYVVHQCLDYDSFRTKGPMQCRYLTVVPEWLANSGQKVIRLVWLDFVSLPLGQVYKGLREEGYLIPEDSTLKDYVRIVRVTSRLFSH